MQSRQPTLPWLEPGDIFPATSDAWGPHTEAPGLLAAGADLSVSTLVRAYSHGIFPWYSEGQPILWWSTHPRMTLHTREFKLHPSLKKVIRRFRATPGCEIRVDTCFPEVMASCANHPREGQSGTWIQPEMREAYTELHRRGYAHSIETWQHGNLVGGLYCVAIGHAVFGESMFTRQTDASKIALAALVGMLLAQEVSWVDCQQVTSHLAFMGARPVTRETFADYLQSSVQLPALQWEFKPLYWDTLESACTNRP